MKPKMERLCVFCGRYPQSKNREHVLPQWLINHTGPSKRVVSFGFDKRTGKPRQYSYSSFAFPACEECNSNFSTLEATVKPILLSLLNSQPLSNIDLHYLLDWFDKVRIGLWLSFYFLDRNIGGIVPKFHIASRIGLHDRMLQIIKVDAGGLDLSFRGCDMPSFYYTPSCFSLIINGYCFINISTPYLFSEDLGFPYPDGSYLREDGLADYELVDGTSRFRAPVVGGWLNFEGTTVYQPMFRWQSKMPAYKPYYDTTYVRENSLSHDYGIGEIFLERSGGIAIASSASTSDWLPPKAYDRESMNPQISTHTIQLQLKVDKLIPSYSQLDPKISKWWDEAIKSNRSYAEAVISALEKNALESTPKV